MLSIIHTALFHPITGSESSGAPAGVRAALAGEPSLGVRVLELVTSDCRRGEFSVAVGAVERSSASRRA